MLRLLLAVGSMYAFATFGSPADETVSSRQPTPSIPTTPSRLPTGRAARYNVHAYVVAGFAPLSTNRLDALLSPYTGPAIGLERMVEAASALQAAYRDRGYSAVTVALAPGQITNGMVTLNVAQTVVSQIVVAGERYLISTNGPQLAVRPARAKPVRSKHPPTVTKKTAPAANPNAPLKVRPPMIPATSKEMAQVLADLHRKIAELNGKAKDTRIYVVSTNAGPRFTVEKYLIQGNTLLSPSTIGSVITNIVGAFGTNVSFDGIQTVVTELGKAYRERGYVTVSVQVPQQKLTHATVKLRVVEGRLAEINIVGNHYFSSNNIMHALPSLHTNIVLNGPIFNAELNRANANQDRQIYPVISPGPAPGTSKLTLNVKDRLPLHAKMQLNNRSSPGTPDLRLNSSAVYNNLWQLEQSLGVQYGFSPELYKQGDQWDFFDRPEVAYYSAFYRLPLGNLESIQNIVASKPGNFGYNEATRQFRLPPPSGRPELNLYASRATIDTGLQTLSTQTLLNEPRHQLVERTVQQDLTINETLGFQLSKPLRVGSFLSTLSGGLDYKVYSLSDYKTNVFDDIQFTKGQGQNLIKRVNHDYIPTSATHPTVDYLPLQLDYHANLKNSLGPVQVGLGLRANLWYSSSTLTNQNVSLSGLKSLQGVTGSTKTTGHWVILRPSFSQQMMFRTNWVTTFRADGQWASEPVISTEQFGAGGVNSVRGYHEGEVFGDTGWHVSLQQQTPPCTVGMVRDDMPLTFSGLLYMDYARTFLIDPKGRPANVALWGMGFGVAASIGSHWNARFLFSMPLLGTTITSAYQPYFNFALTAQF